MRRRGAQSSKSQGEPIDDSTLVFRGSIRPADEREGLDVVISKSGGDIVMRTDKAELGRWPSVDVTIRPIDDTSFDFIAEGDRLVFTPSDPGVLAASPLIATEVVKSGRLRRRTTKKKPTKSESKSPRSEEPGQEERQGRQTTSLEPTVEETLEVPDEHDGADPGQRRGTRLRVLDAARRNSLFDLDRVPIDETLRGSEHEHTWDHRVAAPTGLASRVCTICGKIRFSKSS